MRSDHIYNPAKVNEERLAWSRSRDPLFTFWDPLYISGMGKAK